MLKKKNRRHVKISRSATPLFRGYGQKMKIFIRSEEIFDFVSIERMCSRAAHRPFDGYGRKIDG